MARNHCKFATALGKHLPLRILPVLEHQDVLFFFSTFSTILCLEECLLPNHMSSSMFIKWPRAGCF